MLPQLPEPAGSADLSAIAGFVSAAQRSLLAQAGRHSGPLTVPSSGAALFVDVVGFSLLAGRFAGDGPRGAEALSRLIDAMFGTMTDLILEAGGDVLVYAGDAVLAVWPNRPTDPSSAVARAAVCAQAIHAAVAAAGGSTPLRLRAAVGAGSIDAHQVGGLDGAWLFHATGDAITGATAANASCPVGETVLTRGAWSAVADRAIGTPVDGDVMCLAGFSGPDPAADHASRPGSPQLDAAASIVLAVPRVVVERISAGLDGWLGEFRSVSVGFVNLAPPAPTGMASSGVHRETLAIQEVLRRLGGQPYQLVTDDKGTTFLYAFGLPPDAHEDDPYRAVAAGLAIRERLAELAVDAAIGITTAVVYAGLYGRSARRQYSIVGPSVNLAARLMQAAGNTLWADEATAIAATGRGGELTFHPAGTRSFKGFPEPVAVFAAEIGERAVTAKAGAVIGRTAERALLADAVARHAEHGDGGRWVVVGEAGMGKSRMLDEVRDTAAAAGIRVLNGAGDAIEVETPYYAWRDVFRTIVDARPADQPWPAEWSLLGPALGRPVAESPQLAGVSEEVRSERRSRLLVSLLENAARTERMLVALEDVHWCDAASLDLVARLADVARGPLLVATGRPAAGHPGTARVVEVPGVRQVALAGLDSEETRSLVARTLGAPTLADGVVALIETKAAGNPLFVEQLTLVLRDIGLIAVNGGTGRLDEVRGDPGRALDQWLGSMGVPATVQGIITSRVDRLGVDEQLVIKVASAIGRSFDRSALQAACPPEMGSARIAAALEVLTAEKLVELERGAATGDSFWFGHAITQDVVYSGLTFARRTEVHGNVARWYERMHGDESAWYPRLAHHWSAAGEPGPAARYYRLAGVDALTAYANAAAGSFLSEALRLEDAVSPFDPARADPAERARRAELELMLGKAYRGLSRYDRYQPHLERGVALLGLGMPRPGGGVLAGVVGQALRQSFHGMARAKVLGSQAADRGRLLAAAGAYEGLAESYFYGGRQAETLYACLKSLNLAERAGPSPELARGFASVGAVVGLLRLRGASHRYGDRALATAREVDPAGALPWVALLVGLSRATEGDWTRALPLFQEAEKAADAVGDWRRWADAVGHVCVHAAWAGRMNEALTRCEEVAAAARRARDPRYEAGMLPMVARLLIHVGRADEAIPVLDRLGQLLEVGLAAEANAAEAHLRALDALRRAATGQWEGVIDQANAALALAARTDPAGALYNAFLPLADLGEVAEFALESHRPGAADFVDRVGRQLARFARVHRVALPMSLRLAAVGRRVRGNRAGAARRLRRAIEVGREQGQEVEVSLAELELGCHFLRDAPERAALLARATDSLNRFGSWIHERRFR